MRPVAGALSFPPHGRQTCHSLSACPSVGHSVSSVFLRPPSSDLRSLRLIGWLTRTLLVGCPCQCPVHFFPHVSTFPHFHSPNPKHCAVAARGGLLCVRNFDINSLGQFYKRLSGLTCSSGIHIFHWPTCHYCVCQPDPEWNVKIKRNRGGQGYTWIGSGWVSL